MTSDSYSAELYAQTDSDTSLLHSSTSLSAADKSLAMAPSISWMQSSVPATSTGLSPALFPRPEFAPIDTATPESQLTPSSNMASPAVNTSSVRRRQRTVLGPQETLTLIRICVENRSAYESQQKGEYWSLIQTLLRNQTGKPFANVSQKVAQLARDRRSALLYQTTGTEHEDTEYTNAIDAWLDVLDAEVSREGTRKGEVERKEAESREAETEREAMMVGRRERASLMAERSRRNERSSRTDRESSVGSDVQLPSERSVSAGRSKRKRGEEGGLAPAIRDLVTVVSKSFEKEGDGGTIAEVEKRMEKLEEGVKEVTSQTRTIIQALEQLMEQTGGRPLG